MARQLLRAKLAPLHRQRSGLRHPGAPRGQRVTLATLHDQATRDSWFKKNDYNQFLLVAKGNTIAQYMNGHLMSLFIDDDPDLFLPSGKIGIEVEATGGYWTKNIYLKRL